MAEESGKGIALVILGIVAIIAIVGLVLLFTGARKAAVGEFAVPGAKEYGGAIKGVYDPYARAFTGRSLEFPSGQTEIATSLGNVPQKVASEYVTGEDPTKKGIQAVQHVSWNSAREQIMSARNCEALSYFTFGNRRYGTAAEASQEFASLGGSNIAEDGLPYCMTVTDLKAYALTTMANQYGLTRDITLGEIGVEAVGAGGARLADGAYACCKDPGLKGLV